MRCLPAFVLLLGAVLGSGVPHQALAQEPEAAKDTAATEPEQTQRPAAQTRSEALAAGLQRQLAAAAQLQLGSEDPFLALWQPANAPKARGVLVIVPGEGETADWPTAIGPLRRGLAEQGWHTLSLTPADPALSPGPRVSAPPAAADTPDSQTAPDTADVNPPPEPASAGYLPEQTAPTESDAPAPSPQAEQPKVQTSHVEQMQARIDAAIEHARTLKSPMIVLLGHGTGAYWASQYLAQLQPKDVTQLALVDPRVPVQPEQSLETYIAGLAVSLGDFYLNDRPVAQEQARQRRNAARRAGHSDYRQVMLTSLVSDRSAEQEQLVRRVRGWLDRKPTR